MSYTYTKLSAGDPLQNAFLKLLGNFIELLEIISKQLFFKYLWEASSIGTTISF